MICAFTCAHAQVHIQSQETPYVFYGRLVIYWKASSTYKLYVRSTNPYEDDVIQIEIGKTAAEAYESLENISQLYQRVGRQFKIGDRTVTVDNACSIRVHKGADHYYTAGEFCILSHEMVGSKSKLKRKMNEESKL